jgi:putative nucleotide binding protein
MTAEPESQPVGSPLGEPDPVSHTTEGKEEHALVLDFLQNGYAFDPRPSHQKTPIVQAIGKRYFTLLELVPKKDIVLQPHEEVYIGDGKRDKIHHIKGRLPFDRLTATARSEVGPMIEELVKKDEAYFVTFFNKAQPLTTRMHQLELLPGLGKKHMWQIIEARKEKPFENFADIRKRVKLMPDPTTIIVKRILSELEGNEKHRVFVR